MMAPIQLLWWWTKQSTLSRIIKILLWWHWRMQPWLDRGGHRCNIYETQCFGWFDLEAIVGHGGKTNNAHRVIIVQTFRETSPAAPEESRYHIEYGLGSGDGLWCNISSWVSIGLCNKAIHQKGNSGTEWSCIKADFVSQFSGFNVSACVDLYPGFERWWAEGETITTIQLPSYWYCCFIFATKRGSIITESVPSSWNQS